MRKRIVLADEQPLVRQAMRVLLEKEGLEVAAEAGNGQDALHLTRQLEPDLLILDLSLPRLGGLEVIRRLLQQGSRTRTLVLTAQDSEHFAGLCLQSGATGFVSKQAPLDELGDAVRGVLHGRSYFPAHSLGSVAPQLGPLDEQEQLRSLSPRELTVLRYLANGRSNKDIADELALSDRTVSTYKKRLLDKLHADSLVELVEIAWRNGMLGSLALAANLAHEADSPEYGASFREIFDIIPLPIALRDREGYLLICNRHYLEFFDVVPEEVIGKRIIDSNFFEPEDALHFYQTYLQAVEREEPYRRELVVHNKGRRRVLSHSGIPYRNAEGRLFGMLCSYLDISGHEQELVMLRQARERGESIRHARTQFLHGVGQDFQRTLVDVQRALAQVARKLPDSSALRQVSASLGGMQGQLAILDDLVQLDIGALLLTPRPLDLERLTVEEVAAFDPQGHLVVVETAVLSERRAWIDPQRYRQMLRILLEHGLEKTPRLQVRMSVEELVSADLQWRLELHAEEPVCPGASRLAEPVTPQPRLVLCQRLATLMDGELVLPDRTEMLALLRLRLPRAMKAV
ncbi:Protein-glutamate methylesterase/protein-glutamine glutaminase [Pseudomonas carbonaria]|uniref:Protein-glutamate methylesterase/protein-glutamine glutaminase n=2 Tax=Zestomonas carbonaria TaxID=2762745 RepID=A0A7U7EPZ1_9GAMM|nr:Protein-glutamate methylesterase/protein-glutamine glutaminase [Pseudomonas carbonaria]